MHQRLADDLARLPELLESTRSRASDILDGLTERRVVPPWRPPESEPGPESGPGPEPGPEPLPEQGVGLSGALAEFAERWEPLMSASAGPRYLGFVTGGVTPAALAGDWLTSTLDQNVTSSLDHASQHLERRTIAWLRELFGLSAAHTGAFVTGATASSTVGLAIAREWLGDRLGVDVATDGVAALGGRVRVLSGNPHSSVFKGLAILGLGRRAMTQVAPLPGREAVDTEALERALREAAGPCVVVANAGTVNSGDFDDLPAIIALRDRYDFWLHVDGAFGGFAALSRDHAHLVAALDAADSVCVDLHKWLNVPYDSAVQFTRHPKLQARVFQNSAVYLGLPGDDPDFVHLTPENSRRLRALAAWFTLRAYGRAGHAAIVEECIAGARALGRAIEDIDGLRLLAPVRLNIVCFTLTDDPTEKRLADLAADLSGEVFFTPTVYAGVPALRAAFSNWRTTQDDWRRIADALRRRLGAGGGS